LSAGDEPPAAKELFDFIDSLGMEVVAAGKGKNNPLDREADPTSLADYAKEKGSNPYMMTSFVDGTKSMVEMACLSNATGLKPDCRGMHAVRANTGELLDVLKLKEQGGILDNNGVVEFVIGDLAPGVFLVYTTKNKILAEELKYLLMGSGPNYLLYRPYHLTSMETPISIARAYFYNEPTMVSKGGLVSEVVAIAKKDLKAGDKIDRIGGYTVYGLIDEYDIAEEQGLLPIGLSEGAVLKRDIKKSRPLNYDDVDLVSDSLVHTLRKIQDGQDI
jgi:predicted homoserine dehydrogenase-like protein